MKAEVEWLDDALTTKDVLEVMAYYRIKDGMMMATNNRIMAGYPFALEGDCLVPGEELAAILKRLPDEPVITVQENNLLLRVGRFSGKLKTLPDEKWRFTEFEQAIPWRPFPTALLPILRDLRPFISENAIHLWSMGIAIDNGWCYASNNIVLAGAPFSYTTEQALLPRWVVDFLLGHKEGLVSWAVTPTSMAFGWYNGAWMRSTLIDDRFPERASQMIREAPTGTQPISKAYSQAVCRIAELTDDYVSVYADRVEGRTQRTLVTEEAVSEVPEGSAYGNYSAKNLALVMGVATSWSPGRWPNPTPFAGDRVRGFIAGRTG